MQSNENSDDAILDAFYERMERIIEKEKNDLVCALLQGAQVTHDRAKSIANGDHSMGQLIPGILPGPGSVTLVYGPSTVGKSFLALDLAVRASKSDPFGGRSWDEEEMCGEFVVYLAAEDHDGIADRAALWALAGRGGEFGRVLTVNIEGKSLVRDLDAIKKAIDQLSRMIGSNGRALCHLIIVDHLTAVAGGETMDTDSTAENLMRSLHQLARSIITPVIAIHHTGRDGVRFRGSQVLFDRADAVWSVQPGKGDVRTVRIEKLRNGTKSPGFRFRLVPRLVEATSDEGEVKTYSTAVVEHLGEISPGDTGPSKPLSRRAASALAALPPHAVTESAAKEAIEKAGVISGKPDARRVSFKRILAELTETGAVTRRDNLVLALPLPGVGSTA